jgi:hypothetical protein
VRRGFAATARVSFGFAGLNGPAGFAVLAPPSFDREILAGDEDFAAAAGEALVLGLGDGADAAISMPKISRAVLIPGGHVGRISTQTKTDKCGNITW